MEWDWVLVAVRALVVPVVAIVVGLLAAGPITNRLAPTLAKLGSKREEGVGGRWRAVFYYGKQEEEFVEIIEISSVLGMMIGRVIPHGENNPIAKSVEQRRPVRVQGSMKDNTFFTGTWFHPSRRSHHVGAFQLILRRSNTRMEGMWLGYSETKNEVESGRWVWSRLDHGDEKSGPGIFG
jgi:hypothetical protein